MSRNSLRWAALPWAFLGVACSPTVDAVGGVTVTTAYATAANFGESTVAVVSQVAVAVDGASQPSITYLAIPAVTTAITSNYQARGYTVVAMDPGDAPPPGASYVVETTALRTTTVWYPCYWWGWWGVPVDTCAYPWTTPGYSTGSLLITMTDVSCLAASSCSGPPAAIWMALGDSALPDAAAGADVSVAVTAINQAFEQSPYLKQ